MCGTCGCSEPTSNESRLVELEHDVLAKNDTTAQHNRDWFRSRGVLSVNLMSSPGSGKTTLLERTLTEAGLPAAVVEGDQASRFDAVRIEATGVPVVQVNTGSGCHLEAGMVHDTLRELDPERGSVLFIENVGNLVCPAMFDLGEACRVVVMSVTEGADKPLKYPHMFASSDLVLLNKVDLAPYVDFDVARFRDDLHRVQPDLRILTLSATSGEGVEEWYDWLRHQLKAVS